MQPPFPTKKFFLVLLFLILAASGAYKLFGFLNGRSIQKASNEKKVAILQNEMARNTEYAITNPINEKPVATSTLNAVAAVVYLNQQTKENGATMEEISAKVGKQIQEAKIKLDADTYSRSDILISNDNSPEGLKRYGSIMAGIFLYYGKGQQSSGYLDVIKKALETENPKELKKLDPFITFYKNIIEMSLLTPVPSSAVSIHLDIINSYAEMLKVLQSFQTTYEDLPSAIAAHSRLEKSSMRFIDAFRGADAFFKQQGVAFLPNEGGSLFAFIAK